MSSQTQQDEKDPPAHWTPEIRSAMTTALNGLKQVGVTRKVIATRAGVTPSYVSQLAPKDGEEDEADPESKVKKTPSQDILRRLVRVMWLYRDKASGEATSAMASLREALGIAEEQPAQPGVPFDGRSDLYVERNCDREIAFMIPVQGRLTVPAVRLVVGPPYSGKSSFLNRVGARFQDAGGTVVTISQWAAVAEGGVTVQQRVEEELFRAGIQPAGRVPGSEPFQLCRTFEAAAEEKAGPLLFILDAINMLPVNALSVLLEAFRQLQDGRGSGKFKDGSILAAPSWGARTQWMGEGSAPLGAILMISRYVAHALSSIAVPWFSRDEVSMLFNRRLVYDEQVVNVAWTLLRGQPMLTDVYASWQYGSPGSWPDAAGLLRSREGKRYRELVIDLVADLGVRWDVNQSAWVEGPSPLPVRNPSYFLSLANLEDDTPGFPGGAASHPLHAFLLRPASS